MKLPVGYGKPQVVLPGVLVVEQTGDKSSDSRWETGDEFPLVVIVDDSEFAARSLNNFLWVTFTRSNPAADIHGEGEFIQQKHWGCSGPLLIDARGKSHHAPPLMEDAIVTKRVDALGAPGGPLHGII
jgi:4-hydroxy-3-polyprenylbenzoate decarboxylase